MDMRSLKYVNLIKLMINIKPIKPYYVTNETLHPDFHL